MWPDSPIATGSPPGPAPPRLTPGSGAQIRHRLSRAGNRRLNHVLYIAAVCQIRHDTPGRCSYQRKLAEGKTSLEALRCLRRRLSDVVYRRLSPTPPKPTRPTRSSGTRRAREGNGGATTDSSAAGPTPTAGPSDKPQPGPAAATPPAHPVELEPHRPSSCHTAPTRLRRQRGAPTR